MSTNGGSVARAALAYVDATWCRASLAILGDRPGLLTFLFHALADDLHAAEIDRVVDPTQTLTVGSLVRFIRHFKRHGYTFVSPSQIQEGLPKEGRYVLMTFDDGYYNNYRALPVLSEEQVPAVFFISTNYIVQGRAFWWDVVHRERLRRGASSSAIREEQIKLKGRPHTEIDRYLIEHFGPAALAAIGDEDRPMNSDELRRFAAFPGVHIGNHTADHAILTNYSEGEVRTQIEESQGELERTLGRRPTVISYPNGNYSDSIVGIARDSGFTLGLTVDARKNPARPGDEERLRLGRFCFTRGHDNDETYRGFRSSISLKRLARRAQAMVRPARRP